MHQTAHTGRKAPHMTETAQATAWTVTIPQTPPRALMPNVARRLHWAERGKATKAYREYVGWIAKGFVVPPAAPYFVGPVRASVIINWEKGRKRGDTTNVEAALKPLWDGLTDAGVWADDKQLVDVTLVQGRDPYGCGSVVIELSDGTPPEPATDAAETGVGR
jgi:Holliday junction resolvase RusA-like endonuclease